MTFIYDAFNYTLRLEKGELVTATLLNFVREQKLQGGWIFGLGGLSWAELGFYDLNTQAYRWQRFDDPLELTNLTGNIAWEHDKPILHLHATIADTTLQARGGHLKEAEVAGTVELFIHMWDKAEGFERSKDDQTGLKLLEL